VALPQEALFIIKKKLRNKCLVNMFAFDSKG
jgi:hypothetical protein